ncbi:MAG: MATE family efflux transporter [Saprospiraceae bacterium]
MIGSAAQNAIALTDSVFLYHLSVDDFAAIGFVSVFYLIVASIGYGFSKAGQILIARRMGQKDESAMRQTFQSMFVFELILAAGAFLFMQFGVYWLFALLVDSDVIFYKSLEYLSTRSWGVFAGYAGIAFVALYSGIGRTKSLLLATAVLLTCNVVLDYGLVFGNLDMPAMGIAGAGLASTISEYIALATFLIYYLFDKPVRRLDLFRWQPIDWELVKTQANLSLPVVAQSVVGLGSYLFFFGIVENLGARALAVTNLVRVVYLALSIPTWGFATAINTLTSHFLGRKRRSVVEPLTYKVAWVCFWTTVGLSVLVALFPEPILYPLFGSDQVDLVDAAKPVFWILIAILALFSYGATFFNSLVGAGGVYYALRIQTIAAVIYMIMVYVVIQTGIGGVAGAWATEIVYWALLWWLSARGLSAKHWQGSNL